MRKQYGVSGNLALKTILAKIASLLLCKSVLVRESCKFCVSSECSAMDLSNYVLLKSLFNSFKNCIITFYNPPPPKKKKESHFLSKLKTLFAY